LCLAAQLIAVTAAPARLPAVSYFLAVIPSFMPNGPWFPHPDTFLAPDFRGLPVGVWEIGNRQYRQRPLPPAVPAALSYLDHITSLLSRWAASGRPVGDAAWYNGPANNKQSEPYAALNRLSPV
jgi:hypothetical protein